MATILHTSLNAATVLGPGTVLDTESTQSNLHTAIVTATGTNPVVTVDIEITHDQVQWAPAGTVSLNGAGSGSVTFSAAIRYLRANLVTLSGPPDGAVTATLSSG